MGKQNSLRRLLSRGKSNNEEKESVATISSSELQASNHAVNGKTDHNSCESKLNTSLENGDSKSIVKFDNKSENTSLNLIENGIPENISDSKDNSNDKTCLTQIEIVKPQPKESTGQFSSPSQIITLFCLLFTDLCITLAYSMIVPFFPVVATQKGATTFEVGVILGIYQGIMLFFCPLYGYYMGTIGTKFAFVSGTFVASTCVILFGVLGRCPDGRIFVIMCLIVRCMKGIGAAAIDTASFTIIGDKYSSKLSTVMGCFYALGSIGVMGGPPLGGFLYELGGYTMPFYIIGGLFFISGFIAWIFVPRSERVTKSKTKTSKIQMLKIPMVWLAGSVIMMSWADMGFIDSALAQHLQKFEISPTKIGLLFLVPCFSVLIMSPLFGFIADKYKRYRGMILIAGPIIGGIGVTLSGPSPLFPFLPTDKLWIVGLGLAIGGVAISTLSYSLKCMVKATIKAGYEDNMQNKAVIAGIYASFRYFGSCTGPIFGGLLLEKLSYNWVATIYGLLTTIPGFAMLCYSFCPKLIERSRKVKNGISEDVKAPEEIEEML